jgi:uncharacterized UBP type Zn finger protein
MAKQCTHLDQIQDVTPSAQVCGHVGCCDSSPNRHATAHYHTSGHPLIQSVEPGESWIWCYVDEVGMQPG